MYNKGSYNNNIGICFTFRSKKYFLRVKLKFNFIR